MLKDPVCGKRMTRGRASCHPFEYEGVAYFSCCLLWPLLPELFRPKAYANPELGKK